MTEADKQKIADKYFARAYAQLVAMNFAKKSRDRARAVGVPESEVRLLTWRYALRWLQENHPERLRP